jgi:hypothetical protein
MASERDAASLPSDHFAIWIKSSFGKRIPTKGSRPPVDGRPRFGFTTIDFAMKMVLP